MTQVSSEVLQDAERYGVQWSNCFAKDDEGRCFIDYLREFAAYRPEPVYEGKLIMDEPAKRIIDFMCHRLNTSQGRVLQKAEWFRRYWNGMVASQGIFGTIERGVTERYKSRGPTIAVRRIVGSG